MRLIKNDQPINSVEDWRRLAPPKREYQWVAGRSAFELAHAWCESGRPAAPRELVELLDSHPATVHLRIESACPEHRIYFDQHGGEPRNADLAFIGDTSSGKVAVTVEAKADEPFGETLEDVVSAALERLIAKPESRGLLRVADLVRSLFSERSEGEPPVSALRYQLLTAAAGSLAYARSEGASVAVLLVHEFVTKGTREELHRRNAEDLERFLQRLSGATALPPERTGLSGPFFVPGRPLFENPVPLYVGKVTSNRRVLGG
jgi:hypothetical protein